MYYAPTHDRTMMHQWTIKLTNSVKCRHEYSGSHVT